MNMRQALITLIIGIALGAAGTVYLPGAVQSYLPDALAGRKLIVTGTVVAKEKKAAALLLTLNTPQGALLATFTRNADETNLLVGAGDAVEFRIRSYQPFIEDPTVLRVVKGGQAAPSQAASAAGPLSTAQTATVEMKPTSAGKPTTASPATKGSRH